MSIRATDKHGEKVVKCVASGAPLNAKVGLPPSIGSSRCYAKVGVPPLLALLAASPAASALAAPLSMRHFPLFDPACAREAQRCSISFRPLV